MCEWASDPHNKTEILLNKHAPSGFAETVTTDLCLHTKPIPLYDIV